MIATALVAIAWLATAANVVGCVYIWRAARRWDRLNGMLFHQCIKAQCDVIALALWECHPHASRINIKAEVKHHPEQWRGNRW